MSDLAQQFAALLGAKGWLSSADALPYARDWLNRYGVPPIGVARPKDTDEVAAVVKVCRQHSITVVPQGGNTGLCGGSVVAEGNGLILSLSRMAAIAVPDLTSGTVYVDAGVRWRQPKPNATIFGVCAKSSQRGSALKALG